MDLHTHLTVGAAVGEPRQRGGHFPGPPDTALRAAANARGTLLAGFTTVREAGAPYARRAPGSSSTRRWRGRSTPD
jgi:imidazolonepropionase-like amidohydrolase